MSESTQSHSGDNSEAPIRERKKLQTRQAIHQASIDLVAERGLAGVTVEEICARADISPRTFFNYFPSKAAATLGLHAQAVDSTALETFRTGKGQLMDDLALLMAQTMPPDRLQLKNVVHDQPELARALRAWLDEMRTVVLAAIASRSDEETARLAMALAIVSLGEAIHDSAQKSTEELAAFISATVRKMKPLIPED